MKVRITFTGTTPLLMHNGRLVNRLDPIVKQMSLITAKRKKTDDDLAALARLEFIGGLYMSDIGPVIPGVNIESSIRDGAKITKQGKQVERGLFVLDFEAPLLYDGPRTAEELADDPNFTSVMPVRVGQSRVMRTRPMFRQWAVEADAELDPGLLSVDQLTEILHDAGANTGIGDYRPRYGRYTATADVI